VNIFHRGNGRKSALLLRGFGEKFDLFVIFVILLAGVRLFGIEPNIVLSGSMEPEIMTGSIVYVKPISPEEAQNLKRDDTVTFVTKNLSSVVTVYSVGQKPMNDYTIQVTLTEVDVPDGTAIWGVTVGTTMNPQRIVEKVEQLIPAVDDTLSHTSTNTVQNKIVAEALDKKLDSIDRAKNTDIDKLFG
jgi:hypothetical protein